MRRLELCLVFLLAPTLCAVAQAQVGSTEISVYTLPFSSTGNTLELAVANTSSDPVSGLKVKAQQAPSWLRFTSEEFNIGELKSGREAPALFSFSVDKSAPVNTEHTLSFAATAPSGELWVK